MRVLLQRVARAEVRVGEKVVAAGGRGLLLLVGIGAHDTGDEIPKLAEKIWNLRIFEDEGGKMNRSLAEVGGDVVVVPQFTLYGDTTRGRRPSWTGAASPEVAEDHLASLAAALSSLGARVHVGAFREHMEVELVNDGPVTLLVEA